jgi:hypothetical protein
MKCRNGSTSIKKAKKTNRELHAERCDTKLKLSVCSINNYYSFLLRYCGAVYMLLHCWNYTCSFSVNRLLVK